MLPNVDIDAKAMIFNTRLDGATLIRSAALKEFL